MNPYNKLVQITRPRHVVYIVESFTIAIRHHIACCEVVVRAWKMKFI